MKRETAVARLAMLIECEGSITIGMSPPTKTRCRPSLNAMVGVTNTATLIIEEAKDTLTVLQVGFSTHKKRNGSGVGRKMRYDVSIHGFTRVETLLKEILPWLRSKRRQAELVLEFLASRRASAPKSPYSDREWEITTEVRRLNSYQPQKKALEKAIAYLDLPATDQRSRTAEYYRKYVNMCVELQDAL